MSCVRLRIISSRPVAVDFFSFFFSLDGCFPYFMLDCVTRAGLWAFIPDRFVFARLRSGSAELTRRYQGSFSFLFLLTHGLSACAVYISKHHFSHLFDRKTDSKVGDGTCGAKFGVSFGRAGIRNEQDIGRSLRKKYCVFQFPSCFSPNVMTLTSRIHLEQCSRLPGSLRVNNIAEDQRLDSLTSRTAK